MWRDDVYESCVKRSKLVGKKEERMFTNISTKIINHGYFFFDRRSATFIMVPAKEVLTIRQDLYTVYTCTFRRTIIITRVRHLFMVSTFSQADVKLQILFKSVLYVLSYILILVFFLSSKREKLDPDNMPRKEYDFRKIIKYVQIKH